MANTNERIEEYFSNQQAQCSPYFNIMKFEGVPAIGSVKFNELIVKGILLHSICVWIHYFDHTNPLNLQNK